MENMVTIQLRGESVKELNEIVTRDGDSSFTSAVRRAIRQLRNQDRLHVLRESSQTCPSDGQDNDTR